MFPSVTSGVLRRDYNSMIRKKIMGQKKFASKVCSKIIVFCFKNWEKHLSSSFAFSRTNSSRGYLYLKKREKNVECANFFYAEIIFPWFKKNMGKKKFAPK